MQLPVILTIFLFSATTVSFKIYYDESNWIAFKSMHNKSYSSKTNELRHRLIFHTNDAMIKDHNERADNGEFTYWLKMTQFGDMDQQEFSKLLSPTEYNDCAWNPSVAQKEEFPEKDVPDAFDWRPRGAVTYVKNMGKCMASYAFAATGALEGQMYIKHGRSLNLSAQQIIDCSYRNLGCNGGRADWSFQYIFTNGGIDTAESYPFLGYKGQCHFDPKTVGGSEHGYINLPRGDLRTMQESLFNIGPLAAAMDASGSKFLHYSHGIYEDPKCDAESINLAVLVVGYTEDAWILRLPFGQSFGEQGYMRISRATNKCGVATCAQYPMMYK